MGEATDAAADVQSVYAEGDSDLVSSDGLTHVSRPGCHSSPPLLAPAAMPLCCDCQVTAFMPKAMSPEGV